MQHCHERESKSFGDDSQFAESEIAFVKLTVGDAFLEQFVDQLLDLCGVGFSKLRDALSTMSARLTIALSFVCGFGPE